ncbi:MAG: anthranilate phosphoribosyltransferase [Cytophagales bacterium]|nr:anthranilate phosphoribosyltransferase [Cytophagales bacterium]
MKVIDLLEKLVAHEVLSFEESFFLMERIGTGHLSETQIAFLLGLYRVRFPTVDELKGFVEALLSLCHRLSWEDEESLDVCGTGGDGKNTFNISTLSALVVSASGYKVVKHGNYALSSACGSSDVLEYLGYRFTHEEDILRRQYENCHICFLHAPLFHPAMRYVAPVRKSLGMPTLFNFLGPLINPAQPKKQLVGVKDLFLARIYMYLAQERKKDFWIIHSLDGYDEVSLSAPYVLYRVNKRYEVSSGEGPHFPNLLSTQDLLGGNNIPEAAKIFIKILSGEGTEAQNQVVIVNSALAIRLASKEQVGWEEALSIAREVLLSGEAKKNFKRLLNLSKPSQS